MNWIERYVEWVSPPEGIYVATRWERAKRESWLIGTTIFSLFITTEATLAIIKFWEPAMVGLMPVLIFGGWLGTFVYFDITLFKWGIERFDLVIPWQFRVEDNQ